MEIPYGDLSKLFLQFFSKASTDHRLQEVISGSYAADLHGIAKIFDYANKSGQMKIADSDSTAYGLLAMVVGLSFFRVAKFMPVNGQDNQYICLDYLESMSVE